MVDLCKVLGLIRIPKKVMKNKNKIYILKI